ncbi:MAG: TIM-barrel domain-containing protein [Bacteroidia bacterium]
MRTTLLLLGLLMVFSSLKAQVVQLFPANAGMDDTVQIIYNAALGNGALAGFTGAVYMHTGLITPLSTGPNDWKNVVGNWGQADTNVLMTPMGNNLYTKTVHLASFYGVSPTDPVNFLAFVFRNDNGSIVGRSATNNDIFVPLNLFSAGNYLSHSQQGNTLEVLSENGRLKLEVFVSGIRVLMRTDSLPLDSSYAILDSLLAPLTPQINDLPTHLSFNYNLNHSVHLRKQPVQLIVLKGADTVFAESQGWTRTTGGASLGLKLWPQDALFGGGFRTQDMNLRGKQLGLYNQAQYGYANGAQNLNISIPFFVNSRGYGILFDNHHAGTADLGNQNPTLMETAFEAGPMRYFLIVDDDYKAVLEKFTASTGRQELPPLWSLGYIQSRYGYQTETEARNVVSQLQQQDFPLDALVLDLFWFGSPATMGNLNWDNTRFPNPVGMMQDWRNAGVKTILITETYFTQNSTNFNQAASSGYFATTPQGNPFILGGFWAGSSALLDITKPAVKPWFWNFYQQREQEGVEGWWCDLGEPEAHPNEMQHFLGTARQIHNLYSLIWADMLYQNYRTHYPNKRLFNLIRSGYTGMQRYSTFPWSGDIQRSWSGLQAQLPVMVHMGMSGVGYMHSDIGGFTGGSQDNELYARWQQLGAFSPIQRAHGEGIPAEPIFYPLNIRNIVRDYLKLRMRMLPYNYSLAHEYSLRGTPLLRPMFMEADNPQQFFNVNDQFMWGPNVLVAPVLQQGQTSRQLLLPTGKWIDWWTDQLFNGGGSITASAPLARMPLYIRGDSFLPLTEAVNSTSDYNSQVLELHYFPADSAKMAEFSLYLDDGLSRNSIASGEFRTIDISGRHGQSGGATLWVNLQQQGGYSSEPAIRSLRYHIHRFNMPAGASVFAVTGNTHALLRAANSLTDYEQSDSVYWYKASEQQILVKYAINHQPTRLEIGQGTVNLQGLDPEKIDFSLVQAYPNPFSHQISLPIDVFQPASFSVEIRNLAGQLVYSEQLGKIEAGRAYFRWNGQGMHGQPLSNGMYLLRLHNGSTYQHQRLILQR